MDWKTPLDSILVFGASGRLGRPLAEYITKTAPEVRLRVGASSERKAAALRERFPNAEVVVADYLNPEQMEAAVEGMAGIFMVMPDFLDYPAAGKVFLEAVRKTGALRHLVRISADPPDFHPMDLPESLRDSPLFAAGHLILRTMLLEAEIPTTTISVSAYYMDNLSLPVVAKFVRDKDQLIEAERHRMPYVDPADVAEAAARIFFRRDPDDIGMVWHLNNNHDLADWGEVSELLSKHLGRKIAHVESPQAWADTIGAAIKGYMDEASAEYMAEYLKWETRKCPRFYRRPELEDMLGRKPKTLDQWISENTARWRPRDAPVPFPAA